MGKKSMTISIIFIWLLNICLLYRGVIWWDLYFQYAGTAHQPLGGAETMLTEIVLLSIPPLIMHLILTHQNYESIKKSLRFFSFLTFVFGFSLSIFFCYFFDIASLFNHISLSGALIYILYVLFIGSIYFILPIICETIKQKKDNEINADGHRAAIND
jgi:hypothetical protein